MVGLLGILATLPCTFVGLFSGSFSGGHLLFPGRQAIHPTGAEISSGTIEQPSICLSIQPGLLSAGSTAQKLMRLVGVCQPADPEYSIDHSLFI
jgi:hypothetical protein